MIFITKVQQALKKLMKNKLDFCWMKFRNINGLYKRKIMILATQSKKSDKIKHYFKINNYNLVLALKL